jgi:hypothetical protein
MIVSFIIKDKTDNHVEKVLWTINTFCSKGYTAFGANKFAYCGGRISFLTKNAFC